MRFKFETQGNVYVVDLEQRGEQFLASIGGDPFNFRLLDSREGELSLLIDGHTVQLYWGLADGQTWVSLDGCSYVLEKPSPQAARQRSERNVEALVRSPMPAQIRLIAVEPGEEVQQGQTLMILEAMKMEIRVQAPRRGKIKQVFGESGQTVLREQPLIELEG